MARRATKGDENSSRPRAATVKERSMANFAGLRSLTFAAQGAAATAFSTERLVFIVNLPTASAGARRPRTTMPE